MPCNTIVLNNVELKAADRDLLKKAIEALGWRILSESKSEIRLNAGGVSVAIREGVMQVPQGQEALADRLKVSYSTEAVKTAANRFRWQLTRTGEQQFVVQRRF